MSSEVLWIIEVEDQVNDIAPFYLLETASSSKSFCESMIEEVRKWQIGQNKRLNVVEAPFEVCQQVKPSLSLEAEDEIISQGYRITAFEPDSRLFLVSDEKQWYAVFDEATRQMLGQWWATAGRAIAHSSSPNRTYWVSCF